jgi:hypothetical protein
MSVLDELTVLVESHRGGDAALGQQCLVIRTRQSPLNGRGDLSIEHRTLFHAELTQFQIAGQRGLDPTLGRRRGYRYIGHTSR